MDLARWLADVLRRMRAEAGLTQGQAARVLGLSRPTLTRLESASQNTTLRTLRPSSAARFAATSAISLAGGVPLPPGDVAAPGSPHPTRH